MAEKKEHIIEMSHRLNLMRSKSFGTNELKVLDKYMSKINPRDKTTRKVKFTLAEFQKDLEIHDLRYKTLRANVEALLGRVVFLPNKETGEFVAFQLFKEVELVRNDYNEWTVIIDCHDRAVDLFFDIAQSGYFARKLKYSMRLNSANQIKFYMLMKEYEGLGEKTLKLAELIDWLKINPNMPWKYFKRDVIDVCKKALEDLTDVCFAYQCHRRGRVYDSITFYITPNLNEQIMLDDYDSEDEINHDECVDEDKKADNYKSAKLRFLADACEYSFDEQQMQIIHDIIYKVYDGELERYDFLRKKYNELLYRISRTDLPAINNRFTYFKRMVELDIEGQ